MSAEPVRNKVAVVHTRPGSIASLIEQRGFVSIPCPILTAETIEVSVPNSEIYLLSSVHAVSAVPENAQVMCVGAQTEKAALQRGLRSSLCVPNAAALSSYDLPTEKLIHLGGTDLSPATKEFLFNNNVVSVAVYTTKPCKTLPQDVEQAINEGRLKAVLMFSARAAQVFTDLALCATNNEHWHSVDGLALSPRIAKAMQELPYARIRAAGAPNRNALLEMLSDEHE